MTKISVATNDQTLVAAEKKKIASGDIESVFLAVEFDSAWDEFANKSASFYTSLNSKPIDKLMTENECVVPAEVLTNPCILHIGVVGVTADGKRVKTSNYVSFKIIKGAEHSHTTIAPELNLYQQYLSAVKAEADPILTAIRADVEAEKARLQADYEAKKAEFIDMISGYVVWNNPNPTNSFAAQTIALDLTQYSRFFIQFHQNNGDSTSGDIEGHFSTKNTLYNFDSVRLSLKADGDVCASVARHLVIRDEGVQFYDAYAEGSYNEIACNDCLVPIKIVGFRY